MVVMLDGKKNNLSLRRELNFVIMQNYAKINCIVLPSNMAVVSRG